MRPTKKNGTRGSRAARKRLAPKRKRRPAVSIRREMIEATVAMMGETALKAVPADRLVLTFMTGKRRPSGDLEVQVGTAARSSAVVDELLGCVAPHERAELRASLAPTLTHVPIVALEHGVTVGLWPRASSALAPWGAS